MSPETVRDAMVPEPTTLAADASAQEAGRCFADSGEVRAIFVTEDDGRLLGVVTRKTLVREVVAAGLEPSAVALREIAEPPNFTLDAGLELEERLPLPRGAGSGARAGRRGGRTPRRGPVTRRRAAPPR